MYYIYCCRRQFDADCVEMAESLYSREGLVEGRDQTFLGKRGEDAWYSGLTQTNPSSFINSDKNLRSK